jgi:hypothetical protein
VGYLDPGGAAETADNLGNTPITDTASHVAIKYYRDIKGRTANAED